MQSFPPHLFFFLPLFLPPKCSIVSPFITSRCWNTWARHVPSVLVTTQPWLSIPHRLIFSLPQTRTPLLCCIRRRRSVPSCEDATSLMCSVQFRWYLLPGILGYLMSALNLSKVSVTETILRYQTVEQDKNAANNNNQKKKTFMKKQNISEMVLPFLRYCLLFKMLCFPLCCFVYRKCFMFYVLFVKNCFFSSFISVFCFMLLCFAP